MQFVSDVLQVVGKMSLMLIVLGLAVALSQAVWVAFIVQGARLVKQRQVISLRDVATGMGEDGVWLSYLARRPITCFAAAMAGAAAFRAGISHPGWIGLVVIAAFFVAGPVATYARKKAMAVVTAAVVASSRRIPTL